MRIEPTSAGWGSNDSAYRADNNSPPPSSTAWVDKPTYAVGNSMPYQSKRKCTYPGCNTLVQSGRCDEHVSKPVVRDPRVKRLYNSRQWQAIRAAQLASSPWCVDCLADGYHVAATEVDHIQPHNGNPDLFFDGTNLQSLCKTHHSSKTATEVWHGAHANPPSKKDTKPVNRTVL